MEVHEPTADLSSVEPDSVTAQSRLAHVIYMEIQVPAAHHGQNHTEGVLGLVGVRQVHLEGGGRNAAVWKKVNSFFLRDKQQPLVLKGDYFLSPFPH